MFVQEQKQQQQRDLLGQDQCASGDAEGEMLYTRASHWGNRNKTLRT